MDVFLLGFLFCSFCFREIPFSKVGDITQCNTKKNYQILQIHLNALANSPKSLSQRRLFKCFAISKFKDLNVKPKKKEKFECHAISKFKDSTYKYHAIFMFNKLFWLLVMHELCVDDHVLNTHKSYVHG